MRGDPTGLERNLADHRTIAAVQRPAEVEPQKSQSVPAGQAAGREIELGEVLDDPPLPQPPVLADPSEIDDADVVRIAEQHVVQVKVLVVEPGGVHAARDLGDLRDESPNFDLRRIVRPRPRSIPRIVLGQFQEIASRGERLRHKE